MIAAHLDVENSLVSVTAFFILLHGGLATWNRNEGQ